MVWNKRLRTTAGMCCYLGTESCRTVRIELSLKVVDSYGMLYIMLYIGFSGCVLCTQTLVVYPPLPTVLSLIEFAVCIVCILDAVFLLE